MIMGTTRRSSGADRTGANDKAAGRPAAPSVGAGRAGSRPTAGHGLLWGAVFTLVPYLLGLAGFLLWSLANPNGQAELCQSLGGLCTGTSSAVFLAAASAPYAALGTGAAWVLVLTMQYGPAKKWRGGVQGLLAALAVYAIATIAWLILR
ncbi:hypothetical protein [Flindersiella endophytica]